MPSHDFIARTIDTMVQAMARAIETEELATSRGLLQTMDPRVKLIGLALLIAAAAMAHKIWVILCIFVLAVALAGLSRVPISLLAKRIWIAVLPFSGAIAMPATFITPGREVWRVPLLDWGLTAQGLRSAAYLVARTETAATMALLIVLSTPWAQLLKALRSLRMPVALVAVLGMTHRYIFLLLQTARDMFESRRSRTVGTLSGAEKRKMATRTAGVLMGKSLQLSNDVFMAMQSRGYTGEVHVLSQLQMKRRDYAVLAALLAVGAAAIWFGR
jgi:cobalt/nickel transport system permease protein